ncbi:hypothetical protein QBC44DRAFT_307961 [Cladorrhinum sp. PSN332]|nr:hypothetical protein QBC44DRAFT_307961 [Cladorrhinum sp. PSN332]
MTPLSVPNNHRRRAEKKVTCHRHKVREGTQTGHDKRLARSSDATVLAERRYHRVSQIVFIAEFSQTGNRSPVDATHPGAQPAFRCDMPLAIAGGILLFIQSRPSSVFLAHPVLQVELPFGHCSLCVLATGRTCPRTACLAWECIDRGKPNTYTQRRAQDGGGPARMHLSESKAPSDILAIDAAEPASGTGLVDEKSLLVTSAEKWNVSYTYGMDASVPRRADSINGMPGSLGNPEQRVKTPWALSSAQTTILNQIRPPAAAVAVAVANMTPSSEPPVTPTLPRLTLHALSPVIRAGGGLAVFVFPHYGLTLGASSFLTLTEGAPGCKSYLMRVFGHRQAVSSRREVPRSGLRRGARLLGLSQRSKRTINDEGGTQINRCRFHGFFASVGCAFQVMRPGPWSLRRPYVPNLEERQACQWSRRLNFGVKRAVGR